VLNFMQGSRRAIARQNRAATLESGGSIVQGSLKTRPLWFDGRFLAALDLERDQNCFLRGQGDLGESAGFGVVHGLMVERVGSDGGATDAETVVIRAGHGITPGGSLVLLSTDLRIRISDLEEEESLNENFGLSSVPTPVARTRTGLYVIALRPVEFTANPLTAFPTSIDGSRTTRDGNVVEATAVSLVPYVGSSNTSDAARRHAAVAREIFVAGNPGKLSDSLLPLAMISIERGTIEWLDPYMVRRDSGPELSGLRFGLRDRAAQEAFVLQYDMQLQAAVSACVQQARAPRFAASDYFQALPPAGRLPMASIMVETFTQLFFPQQTDVRLSIVAADDLPGLIHESMYLPPIDLSLGASAYADLSVGVLVPVGRRDFAGLAEILPEVTLKPALAQVVSPQKAVDLIRFYPGAAEVTRASTVDPNKWQEAIGTQTYCYYLRRRSSPVFVSAQNAATPTSTSLVAASTAGTTAWTLTATVLPAIATGTVTFMDGSSVLGTVGMTSGKATLVLPSLSAGTHALTAAYNGDANCSPSSASVTQTVAGA
jgi:hypothetical protein